MDYWQQQHQHPHFWHDKWLSMGLVRSVVEGPLQRGEDNILVNDVICSGRWDFSFLSFDFNQLVQQAILATPLRRVAVSGDQRCWISSMNGEFDSKNAYMLAIGEDTHTPDFHGKWIWKLATLPKIQIFLWKCLHHSLPVKSVLTYRGIEGLGGCEFYSKEDENSLHALRDCPTAQEFWTVAKCPPSQLQSFSVDLETWIRDNAICSTQAKTKDYPWSSFFLFGIWNIWLQRNRKTFKQMAANSSLF